LTTVNIIKSFRPTKRKLEICACLRFPKGKINRERVLKPVARNTAQVWTWQGLQHCLVLLNANNSIN
jgi:hypothetical protein